MHRQCTLILCVIVFGCSSLEAQRLSIQRAESDSIHRTISIYYDLDHGKNHFDRYDRYVVNLFLSTDGGESFYERPLFYVKGSEGQEVTTGANKKIIWSYSEEKIPFTGKNTVFKITAAPDEDYQRQRIAKLKQANGMLYSMLWPGWGDMKVRSNPELRKQNYSWLAIGALSYGMIGTGIYLNGRARDKYTDFENATSVEAANAAFDDSETLSQISDYLIIGGITIWAADVLWVLFRGLKNKREAQRLDRKLSWYGQYDPFSQTHGLALQWKF